MGDMLLMCRPLRILSPNDTNSRNDIFLFDRNTNQTKRINISNSGLQANLSSSRPAVSANGQFIVYDSDSTNLVPNDTNGVSDIFIHDQFEQTVQRVSVNSQGEQSQSVSFGSFLPSISNNGRFIVYRSDASNLSADKTNDYLDIFLYDRQTSQTKLITKGINGQESNEQSTTPMITNDGSIVVFASNASNLVENDTNNAIDVFSYSMVDQIISRLSLTDLGVQVEGGSYLPSISVDGRYVSYTSSSEELVQGDLNEKRDIFVHDLNLQKTERISLASDGTEGDKDALRSSISENGKYIVFDSQASNLVNNDANNTSDVFFVNNPIV